MQPPYTVSSRCGKGKGKPPKKLLPSPLRRRMTILAKTPDYYEALDAKGLALCGSAVSREWRIENSKEREEVIAEAMDVFRKARGIAPHVGVVKSVLRLFDELVKCDEEGVLKGMRDSVEGK